MSDRFRGERVASQGMPTDPACSITRGDRLRGLGARPATDLALDAEIDHRQRSSARQEAPVGADPAA